MKLGHPAFTDDTGTAWYRCHYTKELVSADQSRIIGSLIPQANVRFVIADTPAARALHAQSVAAFAESEANCNTCRNLVRVPHPKRPGGLLYGRCAATPVDHPYASRTDAAGVFPFPPEDWMGMKCWQKRESKQVGINARPPQDH